MSGTDRRSSQTPRAVSGRRTVAKAPNLRPDVGRPLRFVLGAGLVAAVVIIIAIANTLSGAGTRALRYDVGAPGVGAAAPDFTLPDANATQFRLTDYHRKRVLLYFHEGLECAPCWQQIDDIQADLATFRGLGIDTVAAISVDSLAAQRQRAQLDRITLPILADVDLSVSQVYGVLGYGMMNGTRPGHTFVLVGPDGRILWRADYGGAPDYTMYVPDPTLLAELRRALGISS